MCGIAFEWDRGKDSANRRKHGVGFAEASTVFDDPLSITIPDPEHGIGEERFVIIGTSSQRSLLIAWSILIFRPRPFPISSPTPRPIRAGSISPRTASAPALMSRP